ncbi:MAG: homoserine dehydrogenase [Clostridia bacterium]|nr:homoserine dehydrogenase [Clostridia bacterium]
MTGAAVLFPSASAAPRPLEVGLLGVGTVGGAVARLAERHRELVRRRAGRPVEVVRGLVRDLSRPRPLPVERLTTEAGDILDDPAIELVVEALGGVQPAYGWVRRALARGKTVVTANKDLLAAHGPELARLARERGAGLYYEACVVSGLPVLRALAEGLAADPVEYVGGVVNATTNVVLSRMEEGATRAEAVALAQRLGYAEADPSSDLDGWDAARKLAILATLAWSEPVRLPAVEVAGLGDLGPEDLAFAREAGYRVRPLALAALWRGALHLAVGPALVGPRHAAWDVEGSMNVVYARSANLGRLRLASRGAGGEETASGILADIVAAARGPHLAAAACLEPWLRRGEPARPRRPGWPGRVLWFAREGTRREITRERMTEAEARARFGRRARLLPVYDDDAPKP